jgi:hypothetical protein
LIGIWSSSSNQSSFASNEKKWFQVSEKLPKVKGPGYLSTYLLTYLSTYLPINRFWTFPISNVTFESLKRQSQTLLLSCNTFIYLIAAATTLPSFQQGFLFLFLPFPPVLWHQKVVKFYAKNWKNLSNSPIEKKDPNIFMEKITKFFREKKTLISSSNQWFYFVFSILWFCLIH